MIGLLLVAALGFAQEPQCSTAAPLDPGRLSVAWVSPAGRAVTRSTRLTVVPTAALRTWIETRDADVTRMLQGLGLRKSFRSPKRSWKVTIFEVDAASLCRPHGTVEAGTMVDGAPVCAWQARATKGDDDCGSALDAFDGQPGLPVYGVRWRDAAARGFCVLPAERFLAGR